MLAAHLLSLLMAIAADDGGDLIQLIQPDVCMLELLMRLNKPHSVSALGEWFGTAGLKPVHAAPTLPVSTSCSQGDEGLCRGFGRGPGLPCPGFS